MASGRTPQASDVLVTLSAKHHRADFQHPERRITLMFEPENPSDEKSTSISIGRTSRRFEHLGAKKDNCYFDSPVMSREHAVIIVDWWHKKVLIKDVKSMHGTFLNSQRLPPNELREVVQGDTIKFGVDIQRSNELFPPCTVEVHYEFNHLVKLAKEQPNGRPSFSVPEESDSSDEDDDNAESDVSPSVEKLRSIAQRRMDVRGSSILQSTDPIDLTEDDPPRAPQAVQRGETIVLDDDDTANIIEPPSSLPVPVSSVPDVVELDAPHDVEEEEEELVHSIPKERFADPYVSGSESDDSYEDNDAHDYPDDEMSSEGELSSQDEDHVSDEEIHLTDSESEGLSQDEEDMGLEDEDDSESENQDMEVDDIGTTADLLFDDGEYEPEVDCCHQPHLTAAQQYYTTGVYPPPSFQSAPMASVDLPPMWSTSPFEQGEQARPDFRLPSLLNPDPQLGLSDFNRTPIGSLSDFPEHRRTLTMAADLIAQRDALAARHAPWQSPLAPPQSVNAVAENDSRGFPQNDGPSAEDLGHRSGKPEYFAAREHNKAVMRQGLQCQSPRAVQPTPAAKTATAEPVEEVPKSTKLPESAWAATGERFINSPPTQDFPESNVRATSPVLDDTSAFQYEQSKRKLAALSSQAQAARDSRADQNVRGATPTSPKRKADEISTLLPEEEAAEAASSEQHSEEVAQVPIQASSIVPVTSTNRTGPPPAKRTRFLPSLGSIGTFSFGGVMISSVVVGVLAATAPSL